MGQRGTFGYIKDNVYNAWIIQAGSYWESDNILEITKMDLSKFYQWIQMHGEDRFIELINQNPDGYMYPEFRLKAGTLKGDGETWEGDLDGELGHEMSPYANIWLDADNKTINIETKDNITMGMSYIKKDDYRIGQRLFFQDLFKYYDEIRPEITHIKNNYKGVDFYVFFCVYDHIRELFV